MRRNGPFAGFSDGRLGRKDKEAGARRKPSRQRADEQCRAEVAGAFLRADRAEAIVQARAGSSQSLERNILLHPYMTHTDRARCRPAGLEFLHWIAVRLLDAAVVVKVDRHAVASGALTVAAVIRPNHPDTGIINVPHLGTQPWKIAKTHAFAAGTARTDNLEDARFARLHRAVGARPAGERKALPAAVRPGIAQLLTLLQPQ